jgi:hypothetical protein
MKNILYGILVFASLSAMASSSFSNRANLKHQVFSTYGLDYKRPVNQYAYSYFVNKNDIIGVKYGTSEARDAIGSYVSFAQDSLSVFGKRFYGNSFYVQVELTYLQFEEVTFTYSPLGDLKRKYSGIGSNIRIGNQWQWESFTIGCDWFGIGSIKELSRDEGLNTKPFTVTALNFYMGASF